MDETQVIDSNLDYNRDLAVTESAKSFLNETAKWAKFLSIIGFVFIGIIILVSLFAGTAIATVLATSSQMGTGGFLSGTLVTIVYSLIGLLYLMPTLYLYRFATRTQRAIKDESSELLAGGLEQLKSCFKFMGIFMIVILSFYALMIVVMLIAAVSSF